ncbi:MAG: Asp23/Gls24 family envelope stress response protein [Butyrivibrio sp.]|nr:Asp23/Gls24 family envelope stress response protein [Butyrivibrio sp.]
MENLNEISSIKIADDVVARIAALAATEIDGVSALAGNYTPDKIEKVSRRNIGKGSKVQVTDGKVKVDLSLIMDYGYNIPATCKKAQNRVQNAIENMTGLSVTDVNIRIAGIKAIEA